MSSWYAIKQINLPNDRVEFLSWTKWDSFVWIVNELIRIFSQPFKWIPTVECSIYNICRKALCEEHWQVNYSYLIEILEII